jgi:hypothetical protein
MKAPRLDYIVKVPSFATPKMLKSMNWRSLVFYHLLRCQCLSQKIKGRYIPQRSTLLQKQLGKEYRKHIKVLLTEKIGWVEENGKYRNDKEHGFPKSFRISDKNFWDDYHYDHRISLLKSVWDKLPKDGDDDPTDPDTEYLRLIKERHNMLTMTIRPRKGEGKVLRSILDRKRPRITIGENLRVYSPIIMKDGELRKYIIFGEADRLVNVDVSGMMQQILNKQIKDKKWDQWIKDGFADTLKKTLGLKGSREAVKEMIWPALSKKKCYGSALSIQKLLRKEFPNIMGYVDELNDVDSVQLRTQQMEANLIRGFIMQNKSLTVIPAHDGVFCGEKDAWTIKAALEDFLQGQGLVGHTKIKCYSKKSRDFVQNTKPKKPLTLFELFS